MLQGSGFNSLPYTLLQCTLIRFPLDFQWTVSPNTPIQVHWDCSRNSKDYLDSTGTPLGLHLDWTGTVSEQLAGVGWRTSPSRILVESQSVPVVCSDSEQSPIGKVGECQDLLSIPKCKNKTFLISFLTKLNFLFPFFSILYFQRKSHFVSTILYFHLVSFHVGTNHVVYFFSKETSIFPGNILLLFCLFLFYLSFASVNLVLLFWREKVIF